MRLIGIATFFLFWGCGDLNHAVKRNPCAQNSCNVEIPSCLGNHCESPAKPECPIGQSWVPESAKCETRP